MKRCPSCLKTKSYREFGRNRSKKDGFTDYCKLCRKERQRKRRWIIHKRVIEALGGKCVRCDERDIRILQINHIDGGGGQEMKDAHTFYRKILRQERETDDLEVRCSNCNILYEYEIGNRVDWRRD